MTNFEALVHECRANPDVHLILGDYLQEEGLPMILDVGEKYLVMTHTMYWSGECVESTPARTVLKDAAWIPDTGRLSEAMESGQFKEVEPIPDGENLKLNTQAIVAGIVWPHPLPRKKK